jgi:hypothetical protein
MGWKFWEKNWEQVAEDISAQERQQRVKKKKLAGEKHGDHVGELSQPGLGSNEQESSVVDDRYREYLEFEAEHDDHVKTEAGYLAYELGDLTARILGSEDQENKHESLFEEEKQDIMSRIHQIMGRIEKIGTDEELRAVRKFMSSFKRRRVDLSAAEKQVAADGREVPELLPNVKAGLWDDHLYQDDSYWADQAYREMEEEYGEHIDEDGNYHENPPSFDPPLVESPIGSKDNMHEAQTESRESVEIDFRILNLNHYYNRSLMDELEKFGPGKVNAVLTEIKEEMDSCFGVDPDFNENLRHQIAKLIDSENNGHIESLKDFKASWMRRIGIFDAQLVRYDDGSLEGDSRYYAQEYMEGTLKLSASLEFDDVNKNYELVQDLIKKRGMYGTPVQDILRGIDVCRGVISSTEELEVLINFIDGTYNSSSGTIAAIAGRYNGWGGYWEQSPLFGASEESMVRMGVPESYREQPKENAAKWREIMKAFSLEDTLTIVEAATTYGGFEYFREEIEGSPDVGENLDLLKRALPYAKKGITPEFVFRNYSQLKGDIDESKSGIEMFTELDDAGKFLKFCIMEWVDGVNRGHYSKFIKEALALEPDNEEERALQLEVQEALKREVVKMAQSPRRLSELIKEFGVGEESMHEVYDSLIGEGANVESSLQNVFNLVDQSDVLPERGLLDRAEAELLERGISTERYYTLIGVDQFKDMFPNAYEKVLSDIQEEIKGGNENHAELFMENLGQFSDFPWVGEVVMAAIKTPYIANKFVELAGYDYGWVSQTWAKEALEVAKVKATKYKQEADLRSLMQAYENCASGKLSGDDDFGKGYSEPFDHDPFEGHPLRVARGSNVLSQVFRGKKDPMDMSMEVSPDAAEALLEMRELIRTSHTEFLQRFRESSKVPDEDKAVIADGDHSVAKMNNILPNVQAFVAKYIMQKAGGDPAKMSDTILRERHNLASLLDRGYRGYMSAYNHDIPLYEILYREFDSERESGRNPMEIYLGRDGIYAYVGRRAQDATRKSKMGKSRRDERKASGQGDVVTIKPKYLVWSRLMAYELQRDVKQAFLEQESVSLESDPIFYDTGYGGSIPVDIMRAMDFSEEEIERRIRLLSAGSSNRRVRSLPENYRNAVEAIEDNDKDARRCPGVYKDKNGKIQTLNVPHSPESQFGYAMIKQSITRHFMIRERYSQGAPENFDYVGGGAEVRLRGEYDEAFESEFKENPVEFLRNMDFAVSIDEFKKTGSHQDMIVPTTKDSVFFQYHKPEDLEEARVRYMFLISAEKVGFPAPKPVGLMRSTDPEMGHYVMFENMSGLSGNHFVDFVQKQNGLSEQQKNKLINQLDNKLSDLTEDLADKMNLVKRWKREDVIVKYDMAKGEIESVTPFNWVGVKSKNLPHGERSW